MAKTRTCILCKNKYSYCPDCSADRNMPRWHFVLCSENCFAVNSVLSAHTAGRLSKGEARKRLLQADLDAMDIQDEENKRHIMQILA